MLSCLVKMSNPLARVAIPYPACHNTVRQSVLNPEMNVTADNARRGVLQTITQ